MFGWSSMFSNIRVNPWRGMAWYVSDEVSIVTVHAHRNAPRDGGIQLRGIETPLLARVSAKHLLVEIAAHPANHDVFRGTYRCGLFDNRFQIPLQLFYSQLEPVQTGSPYPD